MTPETITLKIHKQNEYISKLSQRGCAPETWRYAHLELCKLEQQLADASRGKER